MKYYEGFSFVNSKGEECVIYKYRNSRDIDVLFKDTGVVVNTCIARVSDGKISDPTKPTVCNFGFNNRGEYNSHTYQNGKAIPSDCYVKWSSMIRRCYDETQRSRNKEYLDCSVCDEWRFFQNFAEFYFSCKYIGCGWELDKDILTKGNRVYSKDTCCFVPKEVNNLLSLNKNARGSLPIGVSLKSNGRFTVNFNIDGVVKNFGTFETVQQAFMKYKCEKEKHIKTVTDRYKEVLDERVYNALMTWEIDYED